MKVGNQEQVCVKLDADIKRILDRRVVLSGATKNRTINRSIYVYNNLCELITRMRSGAITREGFVREVDQHLMYQPGEGLL